MKIKSLLFAGIVVFIMASCTAQRTCPTYAMEDASIEEIANSDKDS